MVQQAVTLEGEEVSEVSVLLAEVRHQFGAASPLIGPLAETCEAIRHAKSDYQRAEDALDAEIDRLRLDGRRSKAIAPAGEAVREQLQREVGAKEEARDLLRRDHEALWLRLRGEFNGQLVGLNRSALCLSGGGIRSGSFALGVLQALATYPRQTTNQPSLSQQALLGQMDFLSTVGGGGYTGGWLSAWLYRAGYGEVQPKLVARPLVSREPVEIENLRRHNIFLSPKFSLFSTDSWSTIALYFRNFFLNGLILFPAICLPLLEIKLFAVLAAYFARDFETLPPVGGLQMILPVAAVILAVIFMVYALRNVTVNRPTYAEKGIDQKVFLVRVLLPVVQAAIGWAAFFLSPAFAVLLRWADLGPERFAGVGAGVGDDREAALSALKIGCLVGGAILGCVIYSAGWFCALPWKRLRLFMLRPKSVRAAPNEMMSPRRQLVVDGLQFAAGGIVYGVLLGLGAYLLLLAPHILSVPTPPPCQADYHLVPDLVDITVRQAQLCPPDVTDAAVPADLAWKVRLFAVVALGLPWLLLSQLIGDSVFVGLGSFAKNADGEPAWFSRAAGWYLVVAVAWLIAMVLVFFGSAWLLPTGEGSWTAYFPWVNELKGTNLISTIGSYLAPIGGISAIITAFLGSSSLTGDRRKQIDERSPIMRIVAENSLTIAAVVFGISLIVLLSAWLDELLLGKSLLASDLLLATIGKGWRKELMWLVIGVIGAGSLVLAASSIININRFSLLAFDRDRLVRVFLAATNLQRRPNLFTGFSFRDDFPIHQLRNSEVEVGGRRRLLHLVNMTLNLVGASSLAWQVRQGESFTVSPLHSGSVALGYRDSRSYGKGEQNGITLGTAMAISGTAPDPSFDSHNSPLVALIMTLFNIRIGLSARLGWWLGNPIKDKADLDGPRSSIRWIIAQVFGLTKEADDYIFLSDGGQFENLGLYEMVRRRCRYIVLVDATYDPGNTFTDLAKATSKIEIDLGVRITFPGLGMLRRRLSAEEALAGLVQDTPGWCVGRIGYKEADYRDGGGEEADGYIVYIKPSFRGRESTGVRAYALAHEDFPHEPTSDQWFGELQFESYRKLGFDITEELLTSRAHAAAVIAVGKRGAAAVPLLEDFFEALAQQLL